ncbi:hypothetical protein V3C99_010410 [Haemonchus contortus]
MSRATGPTTRSQTRASRVIEELPPAQKLSQVPVIHPKFTEELRATLEDLGDTDTVLGRDAKEFRDATTSAVTEAWRDARYSTSSLARQISDNNVSLPHHPRLSHQ